MLYNFPRERNGNYDDFVLMRPCLSSLDCQNALPECPIDIEEVHLILGFLDHLTKRVILRYNGLSTRLSPQPAEFLPNLSIVCEQAVFHHRQ
jgi:hypothetical protein